MKVLVMGGTQFNGRALVWELARSGHEVFVCNRGKTPIELPHGVQRLTADRTDAAALKSALAGHDWDCVQDMTAYKPADVQTMVELLRGRCGHYVFASSTVIYAASRILPIREDAPVDRSERQNEYGLGKILCEDILIREHRERGFPATTVAFSMVFGPHNILPDREQRMFARLRRGRPVLIPGDGTTLGQVGHEDDQARALRMLMANPKTFGRRYNLTGGDCYSDEGYVDTFAAVLGALPKKVFIPPAVMDDLYAGTLRLGGGTIKAHIDIRTEKRDDRGARLFALQRIMQRLAPHLHHWNASVLFGIERLKQDVGWQPEYSFAGAVEQTWRWMRDAKLDQTLAFDFSMEDELLERIGAAGRV
jgi:dTDP-glucose 4,6-dehydratase